MNIDRSMKPCRPFSIRLSAPARSVFSLTESPLRTRKQIFILLRTSLWGTTWYVSGFASRISYISFAFAFDTSSCPASLDLPWIVISNFITSPAIQMPKIGIVLYNELFFAITDQLKIMGGDQIPTACRKDGGGMVLKISLRTITRVTSVMPMFFWAPP